MVQQVAFQINNSVSHMYIILYLKQCCGHQATLKSQYCRERESSTWTQLPHDWLTNHQEPTCFTQDQPVKANQTQPLSLYSSAEVFSRAILAWFCANIGRWLKAFKHLCHLVRYNNKVMHTVVIHKNIVGGRPKFSIDEGNIYLWIIFNTQSNFV